MSLPWISLIPFCAVMLLGWLWQQRSQNAAIVDVLWAVLMALAGIGYAISGSAGWPLRSLIAVFMGLWYLSLAWHLFRRMRGQPEEGRYRYLRHYWGNNAGRWHFVFFQVQALLVWGLTLPAWWVSGRGLVVTPPASWQLLASVVLVVIAWWGERLADAQLAAFKQHDANHNKVCRCGLWRYSRHPNYFFEWLQWLIWPLLAWQSAAGIWLLLAPLAMFVLLYWVTGIPYTEQQALRSRGDTYRAYQKTTSAFIPWRPRS